MVVLAAWPALTLGTGQGSRLLLPLLPGEHYSSQDAGSRSSPHSGSLDAPLMPWILLLLLQLLFQLHHTHKLLPQLPQLHQLLPQLL